MGTARDFNSMLNEHLDYDLLKAEMIKKTWLLENCDHDETWKGGTIPVPFKGAQASSMKWGGLTDTTDVSASQMVRGTISSYKEAWGTLSFKHTDIIQHDGRVNEDSFLKLLPGEMEDFSDYVKSRASIQMLNGFAAKATADGTSGGVITVDCPERFTLGEKLYVDDDNSSVSSAGYVRTINMSTGELTLYDARTSGSVLNLSGYTVAQNAKLYFDGTQPGTDNGFTSLRDQLLASANGGSSTLFGQTKTAYPYLQALNINGSAWTESNILQGLFNAYVKVRQRCGTKAVKCVMSYKLLGAVMKNLEVSKGAYHIDQSSAKVTAYGWEEIDVLGPKGRFTIVAIQELESDVVMFLNPKSIRFHSNGLFKKRVAPDGKMYYETRSATDGYVYYVDIMCFGELACFAPSSNAIVHSINITLSEDA